MATETVIGSYRIGECIGRGGMGVVYRGQHLTLPREVAIKSISARDNHDLRRLLPRFEKEAYVQSQLDHPGIVKVYDYIVGEQTYYIVMEFVEGRSLAQLLANEVSPLPLQRALDIFEQILLAVAYAQNFDYVSQDGTTHKGIVHRDLKPANVLITPDDHVKVTDFGIVQLLGAENTESLGTAYGSPQYVSPEQAQGERVGKRSDIYSLGIILYEMLTGAPPFGSLQEPLSRTEVLRAHVKRPPRPPSEINPEVTPEIEAIILRALKKNPDERFATAEDFLRAVRRARGRDMDDLAQYKSAPPKLPVRNRIGTQELVGPKTDATTVRQSYVTEPLASAACQVCGKRVNPGDANCRACGHELGASPATAKLTEDERRAWQKKRAWGLWVASALVASALVGASVLYFARKKDSAQRSIIVAPAVVEKPAVSPTPTPASQLVEIKPARVEVDSSYDGYDKESLTDGESDVRRIASMRYNAGNWASAETPVPHWIELGFDHPTRIAALYVYWGFDRNRFLPSRRAELQTANEFGEWRTISALEPGNDYDHGAFEFAPFETTRLRILQPAQQGPGNRPFIMWIREVQVFSVAGDATVP